MVTYAVAAEVRTDGTGWQPYVAFVQSRTLGLPSRTQVQSSIAQSVAEVFEVLPNQVQVRRIRLRRREEPVSLKELLATTRYVDPRDRVLSA